ncbi:MAG: aldo/keto reductase [Hyphomicrobiales bacterium]
MDSPLTSHLPPMQLGSKSLMPLGFGCGPLGVHGFGKVDSEECRAAVAMALDEGVQVFDTSDAYGRGHSEEQLALALGSRRAEAIIATKGSIRFHNDGSVFYDCSPKWLAQALDDSLRRLKTDFVDLYQVHYWDQKTPYEVMFNHLEDQVKAGKIGSYGVSNIDLSKCPPDFFHSFPNLKSHSNEFSMVNQASRTQALKVAEIAEMAFFATGVIAQGLLSGKYKMPVAFEKNDRRSKSAYVNFSPRMIERTQPLLALMRDSGYPAVALAIAWVLRQLPNTMVLVGIKSRAQLHDVLAARNLQMDMIDWQAIDAAVVELKEQDNE